MEAVMAKHKPYTAEYKLSAVKLAQTEGISKTVVNLGINTNMLGRWKREHELGTSQARPTFTGKGNTALTEQEKENQQLLSWPEGSTLRAWPLFCQRDSLKFKFIQEHRQEFNLEIMCRMLEVSKSGFYAWQKRPESNRSKERKALSEKIKTIHENSRKTYGSVRVHAVLLEENESSSRPRVAGIMRELGLQGKRKGIVKQKTTNSKHSHAIAENKLERKFDAEKPNRAWVADLTYIPTLEGWLFLAIVIDLFSRKIVGWSMSESLESKVVLLDHKMHLMGMVAGRARDGEKLEKPIAWAGAS
jgi:putative transposase